MLCASGIEPPCLKVTGAKRRCYSACRRYCARHRLDDRGTREQFGGRPVVYVLGNHEFHHGCINEAQDRCQAMVRMLPGQMHVLERDEHIVFQDTTPRSFWMKNTPLSLDILFLNAQRHLVAMQLNVPPCRQAPCPLYPSDAPPLSSWRCHEELVP